MGKFAGETTIHGVVNFYHAKGLLRALWFLALCGALAFFGAVSIDLVVDFVQQKSVTEADFEPVQFPPIAFVERFEPCESDSAENQFMDHPGPIPFYDFQSRISTMWREVCQFQTGGGPSCLAEEPDNDGPPRANISARNISTMYEEASALISVSRNASYMFSFSQDVSDDTNAIQWEDPTFPVTTHLFFGGVKYIVDTRNTTARYAKRLRIRLRLPSSVGAEMYITFGTAVFKLDGGLQGRIVVSPKSDSFSLAVTRYTRDKAYCEPKRTFSDTSCLMECWIQYTRKNQSACMPYFGHHREMKGVAICHPNERCNEGYSKCKAFCEKCTKCSRSCDETAVTILSQEDVSEGYIIQPRPSNEISIQLNIVDSGMRNVHMGQKISTMHLISSIGGTLGLCIGASLLSFVHLIIHLVSEVHARFSIARSA